MSKVKYVAIKEIAREIAMGNTCYVHRSSAKTTTIDHSIEAPKAIAAQEKVLAEIEKKARDYIKIEKLSTTAQLVIMRDFLEELSDKSVRKQLSNALNRKNPFRNFYQTVESDIELNQQWRNFNFDEYQRWVSNFLLDAYNYS